MAALDQSLRHLDDLRDVVGDVGEDVGPAHAQPVHVAEVRLGVAPRRDGRLDALALPRRDDLVVDVGEVLHVLHRIATIFQIAPHHVIHHEEPPVSQMRIILGRQAADVHLDG